METKKSNENKKMMKAGWVILFTGLVLLAISNIFKTRWNDNFLGNPLFFAYYPLCLIYFIIGFVTTKPRFRFTVMKRKEFVLASSCFLISSFILNHSMQLFAQFTLYARIYIGILLVSYLSLAHVGYFNKALRHLIFFLSGSGLVLALYLSMYLVQAYAIGFIGSFLLGISAHVFSPLIIFVAIIIIFVKPDKKFSHKLSFFAGIAAPVLIAIVFLGKWDKVNKEIHNTTASIITRPDNDLPEWVLLGQNVQGDAFTAKVIKGGLVYDTFRAFWWGSRSFFDETKKHDPLVNIGLNLMGDINLDRNQRIAILKSQHDARHATQRKLWSGRELGITNVLNNIRIYPEYRIAYTEKIIEIKNFSAWQGSQQEAAFTFYLPEGSVATSLSLWVNGKEEPSRLTTKSKADSAYVNVVGVQRRDPALLHWQEGNTLTVTVFPCTPAENRKFKIGITTPMNVEDDKLILKSIYFDGPPLHNAMETFMVKVESQQGFKGLTLPKGFKKQVDNSYMYSGANRPYFEISGHIPPLGNNQFSFNGNTYSLKEKQDETFDFKPGIVYLDINKSWTEKEYVEILKLFPSAQKYVYHDQRIEIGRDNQHEVFQTLVKKNFSLFPIHVITDPDKTLLITKSTRLSPNLNDIKNSVFGEKLKNYLSTAHNKINLFQIGYTISPYLKTLKEFKVFNYANGSINQLQNLVLNKKFVLANTKSNETDIDIARVTIVKERGEARSKAPDHLLRLFAYNKIMGETGHVYFKDNIPFSDKLVGLANEAYVVSPVSSLIVLETRQDYERFGIDENKNSLKNASVNSSGAVPEPGEWILIGIMLILLTWLTLKNYNKVLPGYLVPSRKLIFFQFLIRKRQRQDF